MIREKEIKKVMDIIVKVAKPEKIILFGSYASGKPDEESDLDFLVIISKTLSRKSRTNLWYKIEKALFGSNIATDIIIKSKEEIEESKDEIWTVTYSALRTGKVVYEAGSIPAVVK